MINISFSDLARMTLAMAERVPVVTGAREWADLGLELQVTLSSK